MFGAEHQQVTTVRSRSLAKYTLRPLPEEVGGNENIVFFFFSFSDPGLHIH